MTPVFASVLNLVRCFDLGVWIYVIYLRFSEAGRICAGTSSLHPNDPNMGLLKVRGQFFLFYTVGAAVLCLLLCISAICVVVLVAVISATRRGHLVQDNSRSGRNGHVPHQELVEEERQQ